MWLKAQFTLTANEVIMALLHSKELDYFIQYTFVKNLIHSWGWESKDK